MPPVAGFLEMFAGVPYNREKPRKSSLHPPPSRIQTSLFAVSQPPHPPFTCEQIYIYMWRTELGTFHMFPVLQFCYAASHWLKMLRKQNANATELFSRLPFPYTISK